MKRFLYILAGVMVSAALFGGAAMASGGGGTNTADKAGTPPPEGTGPIAAQAPDARLALYMAGGSTAGTFTVIRQQGVVSITNPSTGIYCIKPVAGVAPAKIVPAVSTEFSNTPSFDAFAQWSAARLPCPSGNIKIVTYDISDGGLYNQVAFTVVVD